MNKPNGGSFDELARFMDVRHAVRRVLDQQGIILELTDELYELVKASALAYQGWTFNFPECVLWIRDAILNPSKTDPRPQAPSQA
jgi:hypothetical protein